MTAFSVETLLCAVVQRYGWENIDQTGRQLTLTREDLESAARILGGRRVRLELTELPPDLVAIHTRPNEL
jgi:hypothetical protein